MAITLADFNKIWASTSPLTPYSFSESNYKQGWNFIGSTPPARQMWDFLQKQNDEKMQYIVNDICVPTEIDETSASGDYYSYPVPTGKVFANFKTLGGKTIAWNQLEPNPTYVYTSNGSHALNAGTTFVEGHIYFIGCKINGTIGENSGAAVYTKKDGANMSVIATQNSPNIGKNIYQNSIGTTTSDGTATENEGNCWVYIYLDGATSITNINIIDLTLMFGTGNEPSTVAEFESMFPASYYAYNAGTLLSAGIKEVISKDSSNNVVATMPIPSAVQSLEGYGWSAGSVKNEIDFVNKKFIKRVGRVDLGSLTWTYESGNTRFSANTPADAASGIPGGIPCICAKYESYNNRQVSFASADKAVLVNSSFHDGVKILIKDSSYTDATTFTSAVSGVMLYYELATPQEIDISSILGAVGIACGNTLTFNYDTNYRLPVPVSMDLLDGTNGLMTPQDKAKLDVAYEASQIDVIPWSFDGAGFHNAIYRGKCLGTFVTDEQYANISNGTFHDIFVGDYWQINGVNWRVAACDYWLNTGDTNTTAHHVVIVPDSNLASCKMNDTNITTGAYIGSDYYTGNNGNTGRATAQTAINNAFGAAHILSHREYLQNAVSNGIQSAGAWYDSTFELMNEHMVYGGKVFEATSDGTNKPNVYTIDKSQLPLFALEPSRITNRATWWLRSVVSATNFADVYYNGAANADTASDSCGVRPAFAIKA